MSYQRTNRRIGVTVTRKWIREKRSLTWLDWYWCECEHGQKSYRTTRKSQATEMMSTPWKWCIKCARLLAEKTK